MIQLGRSRLAVALSSCLLGAVSGRALGQAAFPCVFVCNNGNLEGSVTSYALNPDGSVAFLSKFVTGSRPNLQTTEPGSNAQALSLSPNGRYIAIGHGTENNVVERITMLVVASDGTLSRLANFTTPDTPIKLRWVSDELLAVTRITSGSGVVMYRFNPSVPSLTQIDDEPSGSFSTWIAVRPGGQQLYAGDSTNRTITCMQVNGDGTLTTIEVESTGTTYPLGLGISPDGSKLYGAGGISNGSNKVVGFTIDGNGGVTAVPTMPFTSPGASPKQVAVTGNGLYAAVGHGTDSTVRMFSINQSTGELASTGHVFDVGLQGTLGDITPFGDWLFFTDRSTATDGVRGLYSFTVNADGSLTQNGVLVDSQGTEPLQAEVWWPPAPPCPADLDGDGQVGASDLAGLLGSWGGPGLADLDGDSVVGASDLAILLGSWGPCPNR